MSKSRTDIRVFYKDILVAEVLDYPEDNEDEYLSPIAEYAWEIGADPNYLVVEQLGWYDGIRDTLPSIWIMANRFPPEDEPTEWKRPMSDGDWALFTSKFSVALNRGIHEEDVRAYASKFFVKIFQSKGKWYVDIPNKYVETFDHLPCKLEVRLILSVYDRQVMLLCNPFEG